MILKEMILKEMILSKVPFCLKPKNIPFFVNKNTRKIIHILREFPLIKLIVTPPLLNNPYQSQADRNLPKASYKKYSYTLFDLAHVDSLKTDYLTQQRKIQHTRTSSTFQEFFPSPQLPAYITHDFISNQFITGDGAFGSYLAPKNLAPTDACICDYNTTQTPKHVLLYCPLFAPLRQQIFPHQQINSLHDFTKTKKHFLKFIEFCTLIHPTLQTQHTY